VRYTHLLFDLDHTLLDSDGYVVVVSSPYGDVG
jgi:FMN phosphatase YigB (HAD superfamily)